MSLKKRIYMGLLLGTFTILCGCEKQMDTEVGNTEKSIADTMENDTQDFTDDPTGENAAIDEETITDKEVMAEIEFLENYNEGLAWIVFDGVDSSDDSDERYGCINENGEVLFYLNDFEWSEINVTQFSNGYSHVKTKDYLYTIDKNGTVLSEYELHKKNYEIRAYADGYVWVEEYTSDFESAQYKYILYDANGVCVTEFTVEGTESIYSINYYGKGVWGYDIENDNEESVQRFYCTNSNKWVDNRFAHGNHDICFTEDTTIIGEHTTEAKLVFMDIMGNITEIDLPSDMRWRYYGYSSVSEGYCVSEDTGNLILYNLENNQFLKMKEEYAELINNEAKLDEYSFRNGKIIVPLIGADEKSYIAFFDTEWNMIGEPILSEGYGYSGERLVSYTNVIGEDGANIELVINVYDDEGKLVFSPSEMGYDAISVYENGISCVHDPNSSFFPITEVRRHIYSRDYINEDCLGWLTGDWHYINENGEKLFDSIDLSNAFSIDLK